jgi:hypothetical protein
MAMDKDVLGTKIAQDILIFCGQPPAGPAFAKEKEYWTIVAGDIIDHIKANAKVQPGITLTVADPVSGTLSGSTTGMGNIQ